MVTLAFWKVITGSSKSSKQLVEEYVAEKKAVGAKPFLDGAHFEVVK